MTSGPKWLPWPGEGTPGLLSLAATVLAREVGRVPNGLPAPGPSQLPTEPSRVGPVHGDFGGRICPIVGAKVPLPGAQQTDLRQQAHELMAGLFAALAQLNGPAGQAAAPAQWGSDPWQKLQTPAERTCPVTKATLPYGAFDKDLLRRQAHEFIDTLLVTFRTATSEDGVVAENKVPLLQCAAPVQAGATARASLTVANEEPNPAEVSIYCTNFVAESGNEIPSLRVITSPRVAVIPARGQAAFEIRITVPPQTPSGTYSGLLQAMGCKYLKAVLLVQVL